MFHSSGGPHDFNRVPPRIRTVAGRVSHSEVPHSSQRVLPVPFALPAGSPACTAQGLCDFTVTVRNTQTGSVYSQTELRLESIPGEVIPELNPATLPVCVSGAPLAMATPSMTYRPGGNGGAG